MLPTTGIFRSSIIYSKRLKNYSGYTRRYFPLWHKFPLDSIKYQISARLIRRKHTLRRLLTYWHRMIDLRRDMTQLLGFVHEIALHDDVPSKIVEIFDRAATFRDLNEMKYLERVVKEMTRINSSVPSISRKMSEDLVIGEWDLVSRLKAKRPSEENSSFKSRRALFCVVPINFPAGDKLTHVLSSFFEAGMRFQKTRLSLFKFILFTEMKGNFNTIHLKKCWHEMWFFFFFFVFIHFPLSYPFPSLLLQPPHRYFKDPLIPIDFCRRMSRVDTATLSCPSQPLPGTASVSASQHSRRKFIISTITRHFKLKAVTKREEIKSCWCLDQSTASICTSSGDSDSSDSICRIIISENYAARKKSTEKLRSHCIKIFIQASKLNGELFYGTWKIVFLFHRIFLSSNFSSRPPTASAMRRWKPFYLCTEGIFRLSKREKNVINLLNKFTDLI